MFSILGKFQSAVENSLLKEGYFPSFMIVPHFLMQRDHFQKFNLISVFEVDNNHHYTQFSFEHYDFVSKNIFHDDVSFLDRKMLSFDMFALQKFQTKYVYIEILE